MRVVATSNDPVRLSFLIALLADAGIPATVLDTHASIADGSIGAVPRRVIVSEIHEHLAHLVLGEAGEA